MNKKIGEYHEIKKDGLPPQNGYYMVKFHLKDMPIWDNTETAFRDFKDGAFDRPYYSNPKTDVLVGWYENV